MASGPGPSRQTSTIYNVFANGDGTYTVGSAGGSVSFTTVDVSDSADDDLGVLGDISNDRLNYFNDNSSSNVEYVARTPDRDGIIVYNQSQQAFYILSNTIYQPGDVIATSAEPTPICFVTGTRIRTARGEVAVEDLCVGDVAVTASGDARPIRWIGARTLDPRRHPRPEEAMPVRIGAHALGENKPARDLLVSPGHAICLDLLGEVLIPACLLVNGASIVQEAAARVTYWHVELDSHDLLVAEGLATESYLDMGNRGFFADGAVVALDAGPDAAAARRTHADFCRPYHDHGLVVDAVRAQLRRRAEARGWRLDTPAPFADVHLEVDGAIVRPKIRGLSACFVLPATAREVWLVAPTGVPRALGLSADPRALGLCLSGVSLDDGLGTARAVALDDPLLCAGFHASEPDHRWTAGRARLPAALLEGLEGEVFLRLDLAGTGLPRWVAPEADAASGAMAA